MHISIFWKGTTPMTVLYLFEKVSGKHLSILVCALFRHPIMKKWPPGHNWFFMKLVLQQVWLQDWVGGVSVIPLEEYFKATPFWEKRATSYSENGTRIDLIVYRRWLCFCYKLLSTSVIFCCWFFWPWCRFSASEHIAEDLLNV